MTKQVMNGLDLNGQRLQDLGTPSSGTDGATKDYVDAAARNIDWKEAVRAASTGTVTIASAPAAIDGVTLASGDRVLLKDQSAGAENGIYTFASAGTSLVRALDADANAEVSSGMAAFVTEGTANGDKAFVLNTNNPITLGTTVLVFVQFGGSTAYTAGNGLTLAGVDFNVGAGTGVVVGSDTVGIDTAIVVRKFAANIGNGAATAITVTHNLGTRDVTVEIYRNSTPWDSVIVDVDRPNTNDVTLTFAVAPATNEYRVVVHG